MRSLMRTLAVGIVVALLLTVTGGSAFADPLGLAARAAIIPYFNATPASLSFLIMASPVRDTAPPDEHLWFYNAACTQDEFGWDALDTGAVFPFFAPDDGATFFERVIFTCPLGTTAGTLAFDMNAVSSGAGGYAPATAAITLFAQTYDDDENPGPDWSAGCQCVGLKPINASGFTPVIRLKDINPVYGLVSTYTEIASSTTPLTTENPPRFMYHAGIEVHAGGANLEWWFRGRHGPAPVLFFP